MPDYQGENFKQYLEKNNIDKTSVALKLGVSRRQVYSYFDSKTLSKKVVDKICTALGVDEKEIFPQNTYGFSDQDPELKIVSEQNAKYIGPLYDQTDNDGYTKFTEISPGRYRMKVDLVPVYARAGFLAGFGDQHYIEELPKHEITVTQYHKGKYMAFDVAGDSMNDGSVDSIPDKSIITGRIVEKDLWRPKLHTHNHRFWIFIHKYEGVLVKMIRSQDMATGDIVLSSLNPNKELFPDQKINLADVHQILNVVRIEKEM